MSRDAFQAVSSRLVTCLAAVVIATRRRAVKDGNCLSSFFLFSLGADDITLKKKKIIETQPELTARRSPRNEASKLKPLPIRPEVTMQTDDRRSSRSAVGE